MCENGYLFQQDKTSCHTGNKVDMALIYHELLGKSGPYQPNFPGGKLSGLKLYWKKTPRSCTSKQKRTCIPYKILTGISIQKIKGCVSL